MFKKLKSWAKSLKRQLLILYFAYKDPRVPWFTKTVVLSVVAYALSPIDFIPDFIPILGYLDDVLLLPLGIWLSLKLISNEVLMDCRAKAKLNQGKALPKNWISGSLIILLWILIIITLLFLIF
ncbi:YkvA family protein [Bacillaceae bacterium S4-13-56]